MQKNKSEQIIFSAPKRATTLIIAATLIIAPTVGTFYLRCRAGAEPESKQKVSATQHCC
jgi:hypothetical protein